MIPIHPVGSDAPATAGGASGLHRLAQAPHRLFFFLGTLGLLVTGAWWGAVLVGRAAGFGWPLAVAPSTLHATLMVHGFMPFFFWGFVFTAVPKWLKVAPVPMRALAPWAIGAAIAVAALPLAAMVGPGTAAVAALGLGACWLALSVRLLQRMLASRVRDAAHARALLAACGLGGLSLVALGLGLWSGRGLLLRLSVTLGVWGFCAPVFATVAHRMLPFFATDGLAFARDWPPAWPLVPLLGGLWTHGAADLLGLDALRLAADAGLALGTAAFVLRWVLLGRAPQRLTTMLQVGIGWLAVAFAAFAADAATRVAGGGGLGLVPLHVLTVGGFGSLVLAMVTRVSCGHSGRTVAADATTWRLFLVFQAAVALRIGAELQHSPAAAAWLSVGAIAVWLLAFGGWAARYLPVYLAPRADGRPG